LRNQDPLPHLQVPDEQQAKHQTHVRRGQEIKRAKLEAYRTQDQSNRKILKVTGVFTQKYQTIPSKIGGEILQAHLDPLICSGNDSKLLPE
jgi:hypothetical protein